MRLGLLLACSVCSIIAQPLGQLPKGKVVLIAQPHHDDHTTDYGMGGVIARFVESGYKAIYIRASNDEKDGANSYGVNDITNLKETRDAAKILGMDEVISLNWRNDFMNPIPLNELREHPTPPATSTARAAWIGASAKSPTSPSNSTNPK